MARDLTVLRKLGRGSRVEYRIGHTNPFELYVKQGTARTISIPESHREGRMGDWESRTGRVESRMLLWAGQMSFGYTTTSGSILLTVRRCKYTQVVASDPPMGSGRKTRGWP